MPAIVRLTVKGAGGFSAGASWFTHWLYSLTGDENDGADLCDALATRIESHLLAVFSDAWSCGRIDWTFWPDLGEEPYPTQVASPDVMVGLDTGANQLPPRMCMLIEYKSLTVKPNRKRLYVGRFNEDANDTTGTPNSTVVSAVQSYADNTLNSMSVNGHDWQFCVVRLARNVPQPASGFYTPVAYNAFSSHLVQTKWAYLRTRDIGRGI